MKNEHTEQSEPAQAGFKVGLEEVLEDFFGLNIRSFRSFKTLFTKPAAYFNGAKSPDWQNGTYTPSPRLWLGLTAIIIALRFIWGSENSAYMKELVAAFREGGITGDGAAHDWEKVTQQMIDTTLFFSPIAVIFVLLVLATFLRFWGEKLSYFTRLRFLFAALIPSAVLSIIYYLIVAILPAPYHTLTYAFFAIMSFGVITWMIACGGMQNYVGRKKWVRAVLMTAIIYLSITIAGLIVLVVAIYLAIAPLYS